MHDPTEDQAPTAKNIAQVLPETPRLRRALESLGVTTTPRDRHRLSEREYAAGLAGILCGFAEQVETGLRGGPLHSRFRQGWVISYDRSEQAFLATIGEQLLDLSRFAGEGISRVPLASRQFSTAALALLVAHRAFTAAAQIANGSDAAMAQGEKQSTTMIVNAHQLTNYIAKLEAEFGPAVGEPDAPFPAPTNPDIDMTAAAIEIIARAFYAAGAEDERATTGAQLPPFAQCHNGENHSAIADASTAVQALLTAGLSVIRRP